MRKAVIGVVGKLAYFFILCENKMIEVLDGTAKGGTSAADTTIDDIDFFVDLALVDVSANDGIAACDGKAGVEGDGDLLILVVIAEEFREGAAVAALVGWASEDGAKDKLDIGTIEIDGDKMPCSLGELRWIVKDGEGLCARICGALAAPILAALVCGAGLSLPCAAIG